MSDTRSRLSTVSTLTSLSIHSKWFLRYAREHKLAEMLQESHEEELQKMEGSVQNMEENLQAVHAAKEQAHKERRGAILDKLKIEEQAQQDQQEREKLQLHMKARGDMMLKYMAEKVAPGIHDLAGKKEAFGEWKGQLIHFK
jgi:hypothetical protein